MPEVYANETKLMLLSNTIEPYYTELLKQKMQKVKDETLFKTSLQLIRQLIFFNDRRVEYPLNAKLDFGCMLGAIADDSKPVNYDLMVVLYQLQCKFGKTEFNHLCRICEKVCLENGDLEIV